MLTSKSPFSRFEPTRGQVLISAIIGGVMLIALLLAIFSATFPMAAQSPGEAYPLVSLGRALLGDYLVPFELASVLLLVVMIGAAYLAKARRSEDKG